MKNLDSVPKKSNGTKMIRNIIIIVLINKNKKNKVNKEETSKE